MINGGKISLRFLILRLRLFSRAFYSLSGSACHSLAESWSNGVIRLVNNLPLKTRESIKNHMPKKEKKGDSTEVNA